jgi:AraC-like DNA-binding protein
MEAQREARGLSWSGVAREIWELSSELNGQRSDHPISPATVTGMATRGDTTCQHALFFLRWLDRSPESFVPGDEPKAYAQPLPAADADRRLRWNLKKLHGALDAQRRERSLTWKQLASELRCTPSQLTGIRTARFGTSMRLAMRITHWLERPAADFVYAARW